MSLLLTGGTVFVDGRFENMDIAIHEGRIVSNSLPQEGLSVIDLNNCLVVPGFVDVHVHLREPGFSYKETIYSGTEPKIKVYILTLGQDEADAQAHLELYGRWVESLKS